MLAKDESTGEIAAKRVAQTFVRQAPATFVLGFSNGERIETTAEHPFYVDGKGFVPAAMLAIGNSIVTIAGPPLTISTIEKRDQPQTVYNFEVEDFHTYFVGDAGFWVHNATYDELSQKIAYNFHTWRKHRSDFAARGINTREELAAYIQNLMSSAIPPNRKSFGRDNRKTAWYDPDKGLVVMHDPNNVYEGGSCYPMTQAAFDAL